MERLVLVLGQDRKERLASVIDDGILQVPRNTGYTQKESVVSYYHLPTRRTYHTHIIDLTVRVKEGRFCYFISFFAVDQPHGSSLGNSSTAFEFESATG